LQYVTNTVGTPYAVFVPFPTELAHEALLLNDSTPLGRRGNDSVAALKRNGLQVSVGLEAAAVDRLVAVTTEDHIVEFCPSDRKRFAGIDACQKWVSKQRAFVSITDRESSALLAYGWSGPEKNHHVPGADITTAYRVTQQGQVATKRIRATGETGFRLGIHLGELVVASAVHLFGASPDDVSLETWGSNGAARHLYELLGFEQLASVPNEPATRPTLGALGSKIGDRIVRLDPAHPEDPSKRIIDDERCHYVLRNYESRS
jgi:hypothetical protein